MKKETILKNTFFVAFLALVCTLLWGSAFPCIKIGYRLFDISSSDSWSQILFAGSRFFMAGILTIILGSILNKELLFPSKKSAPKIVFISIFQTILQYIFFYLGLATTSGVKSSIITGSNTFIAILVSCFIFRFEKMNKEKIIGCLLGFAGVILVNFTNTGLDMNLKFTGEGFILLSAAASAISSSLIKKYSKDENAVMLSGYQFIFGGAFMIILSKIMGGTIKNGGMSGTTMLIYLAFVSGIAYSLWGILLKYNSVSRVSVYGFMTPVFGVTLSAIFLHETSESLGLKAIIALILVCLGIYIVNNKKD